MNGWVVKGDQKTNETVAHFVEYLLNEEMPAIVQEVLVAIGVHRTEEDNFDGYDGPVVWDEYDDGHDYDEPYFYNAYNLGYGDDDPYDGYADNDYEAYR